MGVKVVYLLWAPLGAGVVERLAEHLRQHPAGLDHELVVAACGHSDDAPLEPVLEPLSGLEHRLEVFDGPRIDLRTYREAVDRLADGDRFQFMNSYCRPLAGDWLAKLLAPLDDSSVGVTGPAGSYESIVTNMPKPFGWRYLPQFKPFPNPHIRTSCFAMTRASIEGLDWPDVQTKRDAWRFEAGRRGLTAQLQDQGLRPVVVGRDGTRYEVEDWPASRTFRTGEQENLLVADLRADDYIAADESERSRLGRYAWRDGYQPGAKRPDPDARG